MDQQTRIAKQLMDLQRVSFDGMMSNVSLFWDQTEKMFGTVLDQAAIVPEEGKRAFREWIDGNKKGCEVLKKAVNDGFNRLESCFVGATPQ